jgi:hypothetical protein
MKPDLWADLIAGRYDGEPEHVQDQLRAVANNAVLTEDERQARAAGILTGQGDRRRFHHDANGAGLAPKVSGAVHGNGDGEDDDSPSTWRPVDLTDALAGHDVPPPELLARIDGPCLLYRGRTHWWQGETESCKTWLAAIAAAEQLNGDGDVGWFDFEDDERTVVARLRALSVTNDAIAGHLTYVRPEEPLVDRQGRATRGGVDLAALLDHKTFGLVVIDGVTEAMVSEGLDLIDNADVAVWVRRLPKRLAGTGAAVAVLDHLTKSREGQGRYAIGGQHKLAGVTGAGYRFEVVKPFGRAVGNEPSTGIVTITVVKDRPGHVRARAVDGRIATLELTAWPDGGITSALIAPDSAPAPDLHLCRRIIDYLLTYDGASKNAIEKDVDGKAERIREAIAWMVDLPRCWVRVEKVGVAHRHYITEVGRAEFT